MISTLLTIGLVINEIMAANVGEVMSPATNFDSWIEIYNPTNQRIDLAGMYLSYDSQNLTRWQMPADVGVVPAKGFTVVWLGSNDIMANQAPFKLNCEGGTIYLSDSDGSLVTSQVYPAAMSRTAWACMTDGGEEWGWTATATPGATNTTAAFASERMPAPEVSVGSRLFTEAFTVTVKIPSGAKLMYTTDGSVPTANNPSGTSRRSTNGRFNIEKTTNLCVRLFRDGYLPSVPVTRSYIQTSTQYTLPIISIVGDERYFSDPVWGIDTRGTNGKPGNGQDTPCNWNMDWDRPVNFSYMSPEGVMLFNQDVDICVSGGWTRSASPRSFKLKAGKEFDGMNTLDYVFFPQKPYLRNKTLLVRNGGNDVWDNGGSRFMDPALQTIIQRSEINLDVQSYVPIIEYVNGKCRGVLNLREPNNRRFAEANFGYDDENLDMFENFVFRQGDSNVLDRIYELGRHINEADAYDRLKELIDIDEFCNYMAVELFLGSTDWPHNNFKAYRSRDDGRYRFVAFDLDFSFRSNNPFNDFTNHSDMEFVVFFLNILDNDVFRKKFIDTFCLIAGSVFDKERSIAIVDELADRVRPMMQLDGRNPDGSANKIKQSMETQQQRMLDCMQRFRQMKMTNITGQNVQLYTNTEGARLYVNGIEVPYAQFEGRLYPPIRIEAKAPMGYRFTGWQNKVSANVQLIGLNDSWRYYDKGEAPDSWTESGFNDGSWASGPAPLGYGMNGVKTTVSFGGDPDHKNPTTYFRKTISLKGQPNGSDQFVLNYQIDDGFIVYVNGKEGGRVNMRSGNVAFDTFASTYATDEPITGAIELNPSLFKSGTNVIAVEIHTNSYTSSDQFWACTLLTTVGADNDERVLTDAVIDLPTESKVSLTACFEPMTEAELAALGMAPVRINEVSAANGIYVNEYWKRNDWVELYNTTNKPIDVEGMYLSDNVDKPKKYQITKGSGTANTVIPAHGYLIIWCDKLETQTQLHASFKLDADGGDVLLTAADEKWSDRLTYTPMKSDETAGRYPDGTNDVFVMNVPTIAKANMTTTYIANVEQPETMGIDDISAESSNALTLSYTNGRLLVSSTMATPNVDVAIVNMAGQRVATISTSLSAGQGEVAISQLGQGVYVASVSDNAGHKATCKFIKR